MMIRKHPTIKGKLELVLLDHGIYADITKSSRLSYTKLWRGILSQDEDMIKTASRELDVQFPELFASMVVNRRYEDIMNSDKVNNNFDRLAVKHDKKSVEETRLYALEYHKEIVEILDGMKRELLLVFKTNDYLRAIDNRLGQPANTFNIINDYTWRVFQKELVEVDPVARSKFSQERRRYYVFKTKMFFLRVYLYVMSYFGVKPHPDYMKEFEFDV